MRITRVVVENFRSLHSVEIELPQVCALVGPNNSGKSNILLAIQRVLGRDWLSVGSFSEDDVYRHEAARDVRIKLWIDPPVPYRKFKGADPVGISALSFEYTRYKIGQEKGGRRLEQKCYSPNGEHPQVLVKAPKKGEQRQYQPLVNVPQEVRETIPLVYVGTNRSLREHLPGGRNSLLRPLFEDICRDFESPGNTVTDGGATLPRAERFRQVMGTALDLLRTDGFRALEAAIKANSLRQLGFDPAADADKLDFFFSPFDAMDLYKALELCVREAGFTVSATDLGEGMQNALVLAILQAFEERRKQGAILLIEEPEMFLHPQMQRSLAATLREIGKTNQVIYTTHSPHFVSVPDYEEVRIVRRGPAGSTVTKSTLPNSDTRREKLIKELDPERNEMFFAARLLLVEGDTEKLALPVYAKRLSLDLDRQGATIVEVGGKQNLLEFAELALSFGIPVGILFDADSGNQGDLNQKLNALAVAGGTCRTWCLEKNYEDVVRSAVGENEYKNACQKYSGFRKAAQARLIAGEPNLPIPPLVAEALRWLATGDGAGPSDATGNAC